MNITELKSNVVSLDIWALDLNNMVRIFYGKKGTDDFYQGYLFVKTEKPYVQYSDLNAHVTVYKSGILAGLKMIYDELIL